jgi:hypothetical protein
MRHAVFGAGLGALLAVSISSQSFAFGTEGHRVVGFIAYDLLTPKAKLEVDRLLAADTEPLGPVDADPRVTFALRTNWGDTWRDLAGRTIHYQQTSNWHFADIEIHGGTLKAACHNFPRLPPGVLANDPAAPAKDCAPGKINQFLAELKDPSVPQAERTYALKFIMHFVGDIHQPLHASDDHDSGGNCLIIRTALRGVPKVSLHHYWDTDTVRALLPADFTPEQRAHSTPQDLSTLANTLRGEVSADERAVWEKGGAMDWTQQSFETSVKTVYRLPPHDACPKKVNGKQPVYRWFVVSDRYQQKAVETTREQLQMGGVRLAALLNDALR